ncbi:hypothetical protein BANRA_05469 [Klebsiella pneumoniae]|nr:hypothetical protein BANRA_05469 [Klebsiella pneumoniae]
MTSSASATTRRQLPPIPMTWSMPRFGAAAGSGAPRRRGSGLASRISEQSEALLQEAAKHAAEFGRSEVDTEHLLLALADSDVVKTISGSVQDQGR